MFLRGPCEELSHTHYYILTNESHFVILAQRRMRLATNEPSDANIVAASVPSAIEVFIIIGMIIVGVVLFVVKRFAKKSR